MSAGAADRLAAAMAALDYRFRRPDLLVEALRHPSTHDDGPNYQRLEFLGDRVLGLIVADMLLAGFPDEDEGALAKRHAALVRREFLADIARRLDLGEVLTMSRGEADSGGRSNPAVLADALEAMIGALHVDGGLGVAESFVRRHWTAAMTATVDPPQDAKTRLQEWAQGKARPLPVYTTVGESGPPHSPTFVVEVRVEGLTPITAEGTSKRAAEQAAAAILLTRVAGKQREGRRK